MDRRLEFFWLVKRTYFLLAREFAERFDARDIAMPHYLVLAAVGRDPGISNAEIARRCFVSAQAAHTIVAKLEERRLVRRRPAKRGGRALEATLTAGGEATLERCRNIARELGNRLFADVPDRDVAHAQSILETFVDRLERDYVRASDGSTISSA